MSATVKMLQDLYEAATKIDPDSVALYESLLDKQMSEGDDFDSLGGADMAVDLRRTLSRLAEAMDEVCVHFRNELVASHISATPEKYLP